MRLIIFYKVYRLALVQSASKIITISKPIFKIWLQFLTLDRRSILSVFTIPAKITAWVANFISAYIHIQYFPSFYFLITCLRQQSILGHVCFVIS